MKKVTDIDVKGKTVFLRTEFNVALDKEFKVVDDTRIRASLPTIEWLCNNGARLAICAHLGRPWGSKDPAKSMKHIVGPLSELLGKSVTFVPDCIGPQRAQVLKNLSPSQAVLLENVRYYKEENDNDPAFGQSLAEGIDVYVNDAFGTCHRSHASMVGVPRFVKEKAAGLLVQKELDIIGDFLERTQHPAVAIVGGAKVAGKDGKIHVIKNLVRMMDSICVVGKIAYYFLEAKGLPVGGTISADRRQIDAPGSDVAESLKVCKALLDEAADKIVLPIDSVCLHSNEVDTSTVDHAKDSFPEGARALDVGPATTNKIANFVREAKAVVWNGPLGYFEDERFRTASLVVAKAVAEANAKTVVGGGDTLAALGKAAVESETLHICTGGGAMLSMLMGKKLPAVEALE
jgi:phosphoglycerate kinase